MLVHLCGIPRRPRRRFGERLSEVCALLGEFRLRRPKRVLRFAGAERSSRLSPCCLNSSGGRVRAAEHAPRDSLNFLERRHGLAKIVERGAVVCVERT